MKQAILFSITLVLCALIAVGCCACRQRAKLVKPLVGTEWQLLQIMGREVSAEGDSFTLLFHDDGTVTGAGACNRLTKIIGKKVGEEFDVNVTFPEDYHAKELAGKAAVFKTKLNSIKFEELPALDDEFIKEISDTFNTVDEYKADVKAKMVKRNEDKAEAQVENAIAEALLEKLVAEIPEPMFAAETENFVRDYDTRLRQSGLDLNTYFKYTGLTLDALREQMRPQAERQVKVRLALEKIAAIEELSVAEEEIDNEYKRISEAYNVPEDQVKNMIDPADIKADLLVGAAMKLVRENAKVNAPKAKKTTKKASAKTEGAEAAPKAEKKPAAKKTTAKKTAKADDSEK